MQLHYLVFDFSDEDSGRGSFDAMACVPAARLSALLAEAGAVLAWAHRAFGPAGALEDEGDWDYELQGVAEPDTPVDLVYQGGSRVVLASGAGAAATTVTFTLSGSPGFCHAFREAFDSAA